MNDATTHNKWNIIKFVGCPLPTLSTFQKEIIRKQLNERYCSTCGEYIYNPFRKRKIKHYHLLRNHHKFTPLIQKRLLIHPRHQLVEWTRHFPNVMKLIVSGADLYFYNKYKPQFVRRIPSVRMWSIEEWNNLCPSSFYIWKDDFLQRINTDRLKSVDYLWVPDLVF